MKLTDYDARAKLLEAVCRALSARGITAETINTVSTDRAWDDWPYKLELPDHDLQLMTRKGDDGAWYLETIDEHVFGSSEDTPATVAERIAEYLGKTVSA